MILVDFDVAAKKLASPAWLATMMQVPVAKPVTVACVTPVTVSRTLLLTEQAVPVVVVKATASRELALALTVAVPPIATVLGLNVTLPMLWLP